ncbi:uncharacterized protein LOC126661835 [Mercurialis annua]|uniref:uncharacterized protein LOC126661835 n=1 Tax=Mercurialis annua TaxID=3986 RepID=UPI002160E4CD|nr:uncharacterized protein LOC126661835 [Mercurialis annua]
MGNGARTEFWNDPWVQGNTMMETFPRVKIRDTDIPRNTKAADLWRNGACDFPDPIDEASEEAWNYIKEHHSGPHWFKIVWGKNSIPMHNFIHWLALKIRLRIKDQLKNWGVTPDNVCVHCTNGIETIEHCLFNCDMAVEVWRKFWPICRINQNIETWRRLVSWFCRKATGKSILANIRRVTFAAVVYVLWNARNRKIFLNETSYASAIVRRIRDILLDKFNGYNTNTILNEILRCIHQFHPEAFVSGFCIRAVLMLLRCNLFEVFQ